MPTEEEWGKLYNKKNGHFAIQKVFYEQGTPASRKKLPPLFTLKPHEHKGLPSAYLIYMDSIDEFDAAKKLAPNMAVWDTLIATDWFMNGLPNSAFQGLKVWRQHMRDRDASIAKEALLEKVKSGDTTAAKAVLANAKVKAPVGRKSKKTVKENATVTRIKEFRKKQ